MENPIQLFNRMIAGDIITDLQGFIQRHSNTPQEWYVGLASDAEEMLFNHHKVHRHIDSWIYRMADSSEVARHAHDACLQWECDGEKYPNDFVGTFVYAYLKSVNTIP